MCTIQLHSCTTQSITDPDLLRIKLHEQGSVWCWGDPFVSLFSAVMVKFRPHPIRGDASLKFSFNSLLHLLRSDINYQPTQEGCSLLKQVCLCIIKNCNNNNKKKKKSAPSQHVTQSRPNNSLQLMTSQLRAAHRVLWQYYKIRQEPSQHVSSRGDQSKLEQSKEAHRKANTSWNVGSSHKDLNEYVAS